MSRSGSASLKLLQTVLPALAVLSFCTRYLHYALPGPDAFRPVLNTMLLDHVASVVEVVLLLIAALGLGSFILRKAGCAAEPIRAVGIGLGAVALAVLGLGVLGLMGFAFLVLLLALLALFAGEAAGQLAVIADRIREFIEHRTVFHSGVTLAVLLVISLNVVRCFVPPLDYDVLEYHLGAPAQYLREGCVAFLPDNVYAAFPSNIEMLFLFALGLKGPAPTEIGLIQGAALAGLINVAFGLLAALAAGSIAKRVSASPLAGFLAAALFFVFPWTSQLSIRHYVEPGMIFFALLAVSAFIDYLSAGDRREVLLAGVFAGLSAGCKYPVVLFLVVPMAAAIALARHAGWKAGIRHAAIFIGVSAAVMSPWLIKNLIATGNPTYPLLYGVFGGRHWSAEQDAKWRNAHMPKEFGAASLATSTWRFIREPEVSRLIETPRGPETRKERSAMMWLPVLLGVLAIPLRSRKQWLLVGYAIVCLLLWYATTHRIARFIAPWFMILLIPAACSAARAIAWRRAMGFGIAFAAVLLFTVYSLRDRSPNAELFFALGLHDEQAALELLSSGSTYNHTAIRAINALPPGSKVLMIGEAETFYCTGDVVAPTVFNRNPITDELGWIDDYRPEATSLAAVLRDRLRKRGFTHVYVNLPETRRLRYSYQFDYQGRRHPGYLELSDDQTKTLRAFFADECGVVEMFGEPMPAASVKPEDTGLFAALAGGTVVHGNNSFFRAPYVLYQLKK